MKLTTRRIVVGGALALLAYALLWPSRISPAAWSPPEPPPAVGPLAPNDELSRVERFGEGRGPEDVAIDSEGRVYGGLEDGSIIRATIGGATETIANTGGRPAGLRFDQAGNLIIADVIKGLLRLPTGNTGGAITTLSTEAEGVPFRICDDVDIASDGTIYFTDASSKFDIKELDYDFLEHGPNGRLLSYDPRTSATNLLLEGLYFANGVAVSPDQSFVLVAESSAYRVTRYWLAGERKGTSDIFAENLPGVPDGILSNGSGLYWVAIVSPRPAALDAMLPYPLIRKVAARFPLGLFPRPTPIGYALALDAEGRIIQSLQDPGDEAYAPITNVVEHDGWLYFGSLSADGFARLRLKS